MISRRLLIESAAMGVGGVAVAGFSAQLLRESSEARSLSKPRATPLRVPDLYAGELRGGRRSFDLGA